MSRRRAWARFAIASLAVAITWLVILPWVARWESVQHRIQRNEAAGIDPSAMFYTELEHLTYRDGMLRRNSNATQPSVEKSRR